MSIQERNRYKKEIDILINRLTILQNQEKSYNDLTEEISAKNNEIIELGSKQKDIIQAIKTKTSELNDLGVSLRIWQSDYKLIDKKIENTKKDIQKEKDRFWWEKIVYENHLKKIQTSIIKNEEKEKLSKDKMLDVWKEYEEYVNKIRCEKWDILEKVLNNDKILQEQEKRNKQLDKKYKTLKKDYKELDKEYGKLLEDYIVKQ